MLPNKLKNNLCEYCHQKPKHGNYNYCGRACSAQAQTTCKQCQQKPKYHNFDFCGTYCASLWQANHPGGNGAPPGIRPQGVGKFKTQRAAAMPSLCRIPGCNMQVYGAGTPWASDYCSMRHREEAVESGLAEPCIMCEKLPRGFSDHFCSQACKSAALSP